MNALKGPTSSTLRLLSLSWRKPLTVPVNLPVHSRTTMPRVTACNYSSVTKPQEDSDRTVDTERKQPKSIDPFGIGEVVESPDKSNILVQGFYQRTEEEKVTPQQQIKTDRPVSSSAPATSKAVESGQDPEKLNRLSLYDTWLKQRMNIEAAQKGDIESFREANFGQVRVDSDNPVTSHGTYGNAAIPNLPLRSERPRASRRKLREAEERMTARNESVSETIEADHSVRIRASDFLKQIREKEKGQDQGEQQEQEFQPRERLVIERIINPGNTPSMEPTSRDEALIMDSNKIPKEYMLPDYNAITHEDMWNILRKTVLFQNDFILAINKPSGIPVHSKSRDCRHTIIEFMQRFADFAKCEKVYPLHRIDKETTGVLLFAKDSKVASIIKEKFANRQINKVYLGVTKLCPRVRDGTIKIPIGEGLVPGTTKYRQVLRPDLREYGIKPTTRDCVEAITHFKVLHSIKEASFVEIQPETGYKHQIRVHFGLGLGCPIIGDHKYSHRDRLAPQRLHPLVLHKIKVKQSKVRNLPLHLHCSKISFTLPPEFTNSTEPVHIQANIPYFMKYTLKRLNLIR